MRWIERYALSDTPPEDAATADPLGDLKPENRQLAPHEHPFPRRYAQHFWTMLIEPSIYLEAVLRDVLLAGGAWSCANSIAWKQFWLCPRD